MQSSSVCAHTHASIASFVGQAVAQVVRYLFSKTTEEQSNVAIADSFVSSLDVIVSIASKAASASRTLFNSPHNLIAASRAAGAGLRDQDVRLLTSLETFA